MRTFFAALLALFLLTGCGGGGNSGGGGGAGVTAITPSTTPVAPSALQGHWTGAWMNQTYNTTGTLTLDITVNTAANTIAIVETLTGLVLGGAAPPPETLNGTLASTGVTIAGQSASFGTINFTIDPDGNIRGSATNLPNPQISRADVGGVTNGTTMTINYTITFTAGTVTHGVVHLTRQAAVG